MKELGSVEVLWDDYVNEAMVGTNYPTMIRGFYDGFSLFATCEGTGFSTILYHCIVAQKWKSVN